MVQSGASHAVYLQQDSSHLVGPEDASAAYQRAADQYGASLQQPAQYAADAVPDGYGDGFGDPRSGGGRAQFAQGGGRYDADQIMRIASQDMPGFSGRWAAVDDGADGTQFHLGAGVAGATTLPEVDWYDPRVAEQHLLAHRQHQPMLSGGYDCGESAGEQGTGADAMPQQHPGWISG